MSTIRIIPVTRSLVEEVMSFVEGEGTDLSDNLVVFPGKRPSHVLRKALAGQRGTAFIPPLIFSYDEFIQHIALEHLSLDEPDLDRLDAASILFEIHSSVAEKLGGEHFVTFDHFLPLGFRLFDELEELMLAGADQSLLREKVGGLTFGNRHLLVVYFEELYKRLRKEGLFTRSMRLVEVAKAIESLDLSRYRRIILAGFYALTLTDQKLFKGLSEQDRTVLVFQEGPGLSAQLQWLSTAKDQIGDSQMNLFVDSSSAEASGANALPEIQFYKSSDSHGQVFALNARIQMLLDAGEKLDERTVIVVPSPDALFPVLSQPLALLKEEEYNISLGYPLARTPLYGLLALLLELAETARDGAVQASVYCRFVLHPYIKNIRFDQRTDITRVLFHALEDLLARRPATMVSLESLEAENRIFERIAGGLSTDAGSISAMRLKDHLKWIHDRTIRPFLDPGTLGEFAGKIVDLIFLINKESTAHRHPLFSRYAEKLLEISEAIRNSAASDKRFEHVTSYGSFLRTYAGVQAVPFPGTPLRGLQVLGLLETRGLSFDRVFVLDVSDDIVPGGRGSEMLLPQQVREQLRLETYKERERLIEYYFRNLIDGAKEVHLFFTENNKRQRSRFIEKILWDRIRHSPKSADPVQLVRYDIHLAHEETAEVPKTKSMLSFLDKFEFSTTALDMYLKCQLRFYYRYVLGLKEKEGVGSEIEQLDVGNLVHKIMKSLFDAALGKKLQPGDLNSDAVKKTTEEVFNQAFGPKQKGSIYLLRQQTITKLKEFLAEYQERILEQQSVEILGLEQEISLMLDGHHFTGRIDRIERRGDGRTYILDYKIRQDDTPYKVAWKKFNPDDRPSWSGAIGSLQLPMYSLLYSRQAEEPVSNIVPAYIFLGRNFLDKTIETGLSKDGVVSEHMHQNLHKVILQLAKEIKDPGVPFRPTEDQKKECPGCPYQTICGTLWAKEGRW
ncbi:MAG: PD-(D/E)XK nuclease family protein [Bacteroidota bacterium]